MTTRWRRWQDAFGRVRTDTGPLLQGTLAATTAWVIARHAIQHHQPFFAPIAAFTGLNAALGQRGTNVLRMLMGVFIGIVTGQLAALVLGREPGTLTCAVLVATALARLAGGARIVIGHAASSAILCVVVPEPHAAEHRLTDALVGTGVALAFTQFLFSPEPIAFVRRALSVALTDMASGLAITAEMLGGGGDERAERALERLRDQLAELGRVQRTSTATARHSLVWRGHLVPLATETKSAAHLDLLGDSCLMFMRLALAVRHANRPLLVSSARELADVLGDLARDPSGSDARRRATHQALAIARGLLAREAPKGSTLSAAFTAARVVAADIMVFAGIEPKDASDAVREGTLEQGDR